MKKIFVVFCAIILTCVVSCGNDKEEVRQKAAQPKQFGQYSVLKGEMSKGGIGYILKSDDVSFLAMKNTGKKYTDKAIFKVKMTPHQTKGTRNGFIRVRTDKGQVIEAGVFIGRGKYYLGGNAVEKREIDAKFDKNMTFMIELIIDIKKKKVTAIIDGKTIDSDITQQFNAIDRVGYIGHKTQTEFTEIEEM